MVEAPHRTITIGRRFSTVDWGCDGVIRQSSPLSWSIGWARCGVPSSRIDKRVEQNISRRTAAQKEGEDGPEPSSSRSTHQATRIQTRKCSDKKIRKVVTGIHSHTLAQRAPQQTRQATPSASGNFPAGFWCVCLTCRHADTPHHVTPQASQGEGLWLAVRRAGIGWASQAQGRPARRQGGKRKPRAVQGFSHYMPSRQPSAVDSRISFHDGLAMKMFVPVSSPGFGTKGDEKQSSCQLALALLS